MCGCIFYYRQLQINPAKRNAKSEIFRILLRDYSSRATKTAAEISMQTPKTAIDSAKRVKTRDDGSSPIGAQVNSGWRSASDSCALSGMNW
jgi:hypothetical protein